MNRFKKKYVFFIIDNSTVYIYIKRHSKSPHRNYFLLLNYYSQEITFQKYFRAIVLTCN